MSLVEKKKSCLHVLLTLSYSALDVQHAEISVPDYLSYGVVSHQCALISSIYQACLMRCTSVGAV